MAHLDLSNVSKEKSVATKTTTTRLSKPSAELKTLGGRPKTHLSAWKKECRESIRAKYPKAKQPMKEHPIEVIKWYEAKGYRAPFWVLRIAGKENRYA